MAETPNLVQIESLTNETSVITAINSNNAAISSAFEDTLSRSGNSPNQMSATLDMNSNQIINLPSPSTAESPARLIDINSTLTPTPAILDGSNVYTGNNSFQGNTTFYGATFSDPVTFDASQTFDESVYFYNGRPWADVRAWGAVGDGHTDDTAAIQGAMTYMYNTYGGGVVYFSPGTYYTATGLLLKGNTILQGCGNGGVTTISSVNNDVNTVVCDSTSSFGSIRDLTLYTYPSVSGSASLTINTEAVSLYFVNVTFNGGYFGVKNSGTDCLFLNCNWTNNQHYSIWSNSGNYYTLCNVDNNVSGTTAFYQTYRWAGGTTSENHFTDCNFAYEINIDDTNNQAISTFIGCIFSGEIVISGASYSMFSACEINSSSFSCGTLATVVAGCGSGISGGLTISGAGKIVTGCYSIS